MTEPVDKWEAEGQKVKELKHQADALKWQVEEKKGFSKHASTTEKYPLRCQIYFRGHKAGTETVKSVHHKDDTHPA